MKAYLDGILLEDVCVENVSAYGSVDISTENPVSAETLWRGGYLLEIKNGKSFHIHIKGLLLAEYQNLTKYEDVSDGKHVSSASVRFSFIGDYEELAIGPSNS